MMELSSLLGFFNITRNGEVGGTQSTNVLVSGNRGNGLCRVNALPNNYWNGGTDVTVTSPFHLCGAVVGGSEITFTGNLISDVASSASGAVARAGLRMDGGTRVRVVANCISKAGGTGIAAGSLTLTECSIDRNSIDEVLGVGIRSVGTPVSTSFSICNNTIGYGATSGEPYMIIATGFGSMKVAICNNTSSGGRGIQTDSGTGSTNMVLANNNS